MVMVVNKNVVIGLNCTPLRQTVTSGATSMPLGSPAKPKPEPRYSTRTLASAISGFMYFMRVTIRLKAAVSAVPSEAGHGGAPSGGAQPHVTAPFVDLQEINPSADAGITSPWVRPETPTYLAAARPGGTTSVTTATRAPTWVAFSARLYSHANLPASMIPNSNSINNGKTSANSAALAPRLSRMKPLQVICPSPRLAGSHSGSGPPPRSRSCSTPACRARSH